MKAVQLTTLDTHLSGGFAVVTVSADDMPAFVSAVAGMCEAMALEPAGQDELQVGNGTFWADCFTVQTDGAWRWQAELHRRGQATYSLHFDSQEDAEALRRRLTEVGA